MFSANFPSLSLFAVAVSVGGAAAFVGAFMVLRRMALVGDALTHVALPGIGLAIRFGINPFLGAFTLLLAAITAIWALQTKTRLYTEALVGLFFTASLAIGILLTPEPDLFESLFGDITRLTGAAAVVSSVAAIAALGLLIRISPRLLLVTLSSDLAKTNGVSVARTNLLYLILVALVVALGIGTIGTLLMGALVIVPPLAAKNFGGGFRRYAALSIVFGVISSAIGVFLAAAYGVPPGAAVVLVGSLLFVLSLAFRR